MPGQHEKSLTSNRILDKARSYPGVSAGIANAAELKASPSYENYTPVSWRNTIVNESDSYMDWPPDVKSVLVLALPSPFSEPELDWWDGRNTEGNRRLMAIADDLKQWCEDELNITAYALPYHPEKGGIFLKEAAVLAGIGIIGRNNLLMMPELGPRVRLRALFLNADLPTSERPDWFNPCEGCDMPCLRSCPRNAFETGSYQRNPCMMEMETNRDDRTDSGIKDEEGNPGFYIKYCRACEHSCLVGA